MTVKYDLAVHQLFFTSDSHFGHKSMANHWRRGKFPVAGLGDDQKDAMDAELIHQWNSVVPPCGIVYHIGDVTFRNAKETGKILDKLNGEVHLIPGNHDKKQINVLRDWGWIIEPQYLEIDVGEQRIIMCHYAFRSWNRMHYGAWNLHGHSHGNLEESNGKQLDVGVDCESVTTALRPLTYFEIHAWMARTQFVPVDHHTQKE